MRPGERLSNDRLFRVRGFGARQGEAGSSSATPGTGAAEGERSALTTSGVLSLGSDFAMAFEVGSGANTSHEWWLGRVLALHRKAANGRSHGSVAEISLDGELQGVQVVAAWYEPQAGSQRSEYTLGTARARHDQVLARARARPASPRLLSGDGHVQARRYPEPARCARCSLAPHHA
jgi:hypothetical protein